MRVVRLQHASVNVHGRLADAARFYANVLGLTPAQRPDIPGIDGAWFDLGDSQLHLVDAPTRGSGVDPVAQHFCLLVDDLDAAVRELAAAGVTMETGAQGTTRQVWFTDPAGNVVEIQQAPHTGARPTD